MRRDFLEFLGECNGGAFVLDCAEKLEELMKAIQETGKTGNLNIDLKISKNDDGTATVLGTLKIKKPTKSRGPSVFFIHKDQLHAEHPNQMTMFDNSKVRSIDEGRREVKEI